MSAQPLPRLLDLYVERHYNEGRRGCRILYPRITQTYEGESVEQPPQDAVPMPNAILGLSDKSDALYGEEILNREARLIEWWIIQLEKRKYYIKTYDDYLNVKAEWERAPQDSEKWSTMRTEILTTLGAEQLKDDGKLFFGHVHGLTHHRVNCQRLLFDDTKRFADSVIMWDRSAEIRRPIADCCYDGAYLHQGYDDSEEDSYWPNSDDVQRHACNVMKRVRSGNANDGNAEQG